jgi:hypothetical protein
MQATDEKVVVISGLSFSLLKDTGWYQVAEGAEQELQTGKNAGCSYFNSPFSTKESSNKNCDKSG